ncbi:UNVERIFIED_ORG: hypothetical protein [Escherichia phage CMSTMSU]
MLRHWNTTERLKEVEEDYKSLKAKVDHFVGQFIEEDDDKQY